MVDSFPFGAQAISSGYGSFGDGSCSDHLCSSNRRDGMMEWFTFFNFPPSELEFVRSFEGKFFQAPERVEGISLVHADMFHTDS